jgi:YVTN family beta-propeller protein
MSIRFAFTTVGTALFACAPCALSLAVAACDFSQAPAAPSAESRPAPTTEVLARPVAYDAVYVVNGGDHSLTVIDTERNEVAGTIRLHDVEYPHHVYLSPDRARLLVAVPGMDFAGGHSAAHRLTGGPEGAVLMLDALTGALEAFVRTQASNHNATFTRDGNEIWTAIAGSPGRVLVLDPTTLAIRQEIAVGPGPAEVTFSPDGSYGFVAATGSDQISVVSTSTKKVERTIGVGRAPVGAWQGQNGIAYVDNETDASLTVIDTHTLDVVGTDYLGFVPGMVALGPDGNVWVADPNGHRVVLRTARGDAVVGQISAGDGAHGIVFRGDGKLAYVSNELANTVSVIDVERRAPIKVLAVGTKPNGMVARAK